MGAGLRCEDGIAPNSLTHMLLVLATLANTKWHKKPEND